MSLSLTKDNFAPYVYNKYFLETGTYTGGGVEVALYFGFPHIISIEVDPIFYNAAKRKYGAAPGVNLVLGDSAKVLWDVIKDINEPITFWLDSHLVESNRNFEKVEEAVPLLLELDIIKRHPIKTHTILIDDRRMMELKNVTGGWAATEWGKISEQAVIEKLTEINRDYIIEYIDSTNARQDIIVARPE